MKRISVLLIGFIAVATTSTFAQETTPVTPVKTAAQRGLSLSVGPEFVVPIGTLRSQQKYKFGIGGSAKLVLPLSSNWDGTISVGYIGFSRSKFDTAINENTFTTIPFKAGIRYRANSGLYVEPQVGYTQIKDKNTEGSGQFTYALNVGYLINNMIDLSVRYEGFSGKFNGGSTESVKLLGLRLAYNFNFASVK